MRKIAMSVERPGSLLSPILASFGSSCATFLPCAYWHNTKGTDSVSYKCDKLQVRMLIFHITAYGVKRRSREVRQIWLQITGKPFRA